MSKQAKVLNDAEIKRIKAVIKDNRYATRNLTMFTLALNVGLRAKEIASIKVSDVLTDDMKIRDMCVLAKEQTKRNEANRVFFNKAVRKQLEKYFDENIHLKHSADAVLFQTKNFKAFTSNTIVDLFAKIFKLANIQQASSHSMRRTFATQLNDMGVSVFTIQKLMRHKNISTTQLYVNVTDTQLVNATDNLNFG